MSELHVVKQPDIFTSEISGTTMKADRIVGILVPQSPSVIECGTTLSGLESEQAINLDDDQIDRIIDFYERTFALEHAKRPFFNCHLFALRAVGYAVQLRMEDTAEMHKIGPYDYVDSNALQPGRHYTTVTPQNFINHSLIGVDRPDYSLNVKGDYGPLILSKNSDLIPYYGANGMNEPQYALKTAPAAA